MQPRLPNFIVVGAAKSGTTSICHYLSEHPEVFMSSPKEVNYFSREEIDAQELYYDCFKVRNLDEYIKLFSDVTNEKAVGEGSVSYLYYPKTPFKIKECLPEAKIIIMLRDPLSRGFSHYLMDHRLGLVDVSYDTIVRQDSQSDKQHLYYQQYVELGLYYNQVKRYLDTFGRESVKIFLQEDLRDNPEKVILELYVFLGIDYSYIPDLSRKHNAFSMPKNSLIHKLYTSHTLRTLTSNLFPRRLKKLIKNLLFKRGKKPLLSSETLDCLIDIYNDDVQKLEKLIGRDLSGWCQRGNYE